VQVDGVANLVGQDFAGLQLSFGLNLVGGEGYGLQLGALDLVRGRFHGVQLAALASVTHEDLTGLQLSLGVSSASALSGIQIGLINIGGDVVGAQLGVINIARSVRGAQLGFINIARSVEGAAIGLLSFIQNGTHALEVYGNDLMPLNLGTKLGSQRAYGILGAGIDPFRDSVRWSMAAGLGVHFPVRMFYLDLDALVHSMQPDIRVWDASYFHVYSELRLLFGWQALPRLAVFLGPTVHVSATNDPCCGGQVSQFDGAERQWQQGATSIRFGPGLAGGIRSF
jgi:hypothetical protein